MDSVHKNMHYEKTENIKMTEKPKKQHATFNIDCEVFTQLEEYCRRERRTKSATVEIAIEKFLEMNQEEHN